MPPKCEIDSQTECEPLAFLQRAEAAENQNRVPFVRSGKFGLLKCSDELAKSIQSLMIKSRECAAIKLGLIK